MEWSWKSIYRFHDPLPYISDGLAFEYCVSAKDHVDLHIPPRYIVSELVFCPLIFSLSCNDHLINLTISSVWVASIVRVTTFDQFKVDDITYTLLSPAIWSVTEQALGITCTCLPTLRPLFGRILSGRTKRDAHGTLNSARRHEIQLLKLSGKPTVKRSSGDESSRGFARLPEENMVLSSITSYATAGLRNDEEVIPKAILKSQRIEQHYENAEGV